MARRTALLTAAVLVAALGTLLVALYVRGVDDRALAGQAPVPVLVATTTIAPGAPAATATKLVTLRQLPADAVAPGAVADLASLGDQVTLSTVLPGQQLMAAMFGPPGASSPLVLPKGTLAVSVQLADPARVAGFVAPNSEVAVFVTLDTGNAATGGTAATATTRLLLPRATVVAVGPTSNAPTISSGGDGTTGAGVGNPVTNTETLPRAILTLALDQRDVERLVFASQQGELYLGLLTENSTVAPGDGVTLDTLFP